MTNLTAGPCESLPRLLSRTPKHRLEMMTEEDKLISLRPTASCIACSTTRVNGSEAVFACSVCSWLFA